MSDISTFISNYIAQCAKNGKSALLEIFAEAKAEIAEIDKKLHDADALRIRRSNLLKLLGELGDDSMKKKRKIPDGPRIEIDEDEEEYEALRAAICDTIADKGPLTNRELIQAVGSYQQDIKVIRAIKWLGEREIVTRDGSDDNKIIPGSNWDQRKQEVDNGSES